MGIITEGKEMLDESALTGEKAFPVKKKPEPLVTGATINTAGHFLMKATRWETTQHLAQIIHAVDEATSSKEPP
jgi:cation transport ATPase